MDAKLCWGKKGKRSRTCLRLAFQKHGRHKRRFSSKGSLLLCYSVFKKTGIPKRIMYFEKGEWTDFPSNLIASINKDLNLKKPAIEVEIDGQYFVLDFLHMFRLDLKTGVMHPIGWIDEADRCFFPEAFTGDDEACQCCEREYATDVKTDKSVEDIQETKIDLNLVPESENPFVYGQFNEQLDSSAVERMFLMGMNSCGGVHILDIRPCSSTQYRLERFLKQVEIMKKYRGTANVQYAWLASSKAALSTIMIHGLVNCGLSAIPQLYGCGIHLAASEFTSESVRFCNVDENGVRYMILCHVRMGKTELICPGSRQYHPSSEDVDNEVDDLQHR